MAGDRLFGVGLFVRFAVYVSRGRLSISVCSSFPFGFGWDVGFDDSNSWSLPFYFLCIRT